MMIVNTRTNEDGSHAIEEQSHRTEVWMDGYVEVPAGLRGGVYACLGRCDLVIEGGVLAGVVPYPEEETDGGGGDGVT